MFEQEIDLVKKHLLEQLFSSQQYIYIHEILNNPALDDAYKTFFHAEVAWWIYEEQALRQSNPRFDIDAPEMRQVFADLDARYANVARFDHEELAATADAAAKARLNFLVRPRTALKWFVFRGEPTKPLHEILLRMNFFSDHKYLVDGFKEWSKQRRIDRPMEILSVVEFERIIERIDNEAIFDLSPQQFVELLAPVFSYFQVPSTRIPVHTIPTEALIIFLDDKGVVPISQTLENMLYNDELRYITKERFLDVVDNIVQNMDAEQNVIPDATLPLEFDAVLPAHTEKADVVKDIIPEEITPELSVPEVVKTEEALNEGEISLKEETSQESEILQEEDLQEEETLQEAEILKERDTLKVEIEEESLSESDSENEVLKETEVSGEEGYLFKNAEAAEETEIDVEPEIVKTPDEQNDNVEHFFNNIFTDTQPKKDDFKSEIPDEEEPFDSFLEDIHRFKNTESIVEFDGSLPEDIIEQTILQENFDPAEMSETEKHKQELAAEQSGEPKLPSISQFIDAKHIEKFTKKLFKRDNVEYVKFLKELEGIPQWKEAARRIDRHLAQNGIEPDSSVAEEFRDLVHKRYGK